MPPRPAFGGATPQQNFLLHFFRFRTPPPKKNSNKEEKNSVSAFCPIWVGGGGLTLAGKKFPPQTPPIFARSQKIIKKIPLYFLEFGLKNIQFSSGLL